MVVYSVLGSDKKQYPLSQSHSGLVDSRARYEREGFFVSPTLADGFHGLCFAHDCAHGGGVPL